MQREKDTGEKNDQALQPAEKQTLEIKEFILLSSHDLRPANIHVVIDHFNRCHLKQYRKKTFLICNHKALITIDEDIHP